VNVIVSADSTEF